MPLEDLYSSILHGRLNLRLSLANSRAPERSVLLSRLVAMPVKQHLQLQVITVPATHHACMEAGRVAAIDGQLLPG